MFAVIKTGGKQYKVAAGDKITIEKLDLEAGSSYTFSEILMIGNGSEVTVGAPMIAGAGVTATILDQVRDKKKISFKKRRRQNSKRKRGHRQSQTVVEIQSILASGVTAATATAVKAPAPKAASALKAQAAVSASAGKLDASNLSLISGIGPTIEKKLRAAGITTWNEIAAWSDADVEKWNEELALRGRATREEWVVQAQELLAGKPPRAKTDQVELASGKDY